MRSAAAAVVVAVAAGWSAAAAPAPPGAGSEPAPAPASEPAADPASGPGGDGAIAIPRAYLIAPGPPTEAPASRPDREGRQALDGRTYTVVAPIFLGRAEEDFGNLSFLRFPNGSDQTAATTVSIVGTPTGRLYGNITVTVPSLASPQFSINQILSTAGITGFLPGDSDYSLYLRNPTPFTGVQHVIFNGTTRFFENASVCTFDPETDYSAINQSLINVHTTALPAFPSIVFLHHYGATAATYRASVIEARQGTVKGQFTFRMEANESYSIPMQWYQDNVNWVPTANELHANIVFENLSGPYQAITGQAIFNQQLGALINMSQVCGINF